MIDKKELFGEFTPDLTLELADCLKRFMRHSTRPQPTDYMYQDTNDTAAALKRRRKQERAL